MKFATGIAKRVVKTAMLAPMTPIPEVLPPAIFNAPTRLSYPARTMMVAAQAAVILSLTMTANPFAGIHYLKLENFATEIAQQAVKTRTRVLSMPWWAPHQPVTRTVLIPRFPLVHREMAVALPAATTSTMMIVLPSVPIASWKPEKPVMGIAQALAMMGSFALRIL